MNMEPKNHPLEKEKFSETSIFGSNVNFSGVYCLFITMDIYLHLNVACFLPTPSNSKREILQLEIPLL